MVSRFFNIIPIFFIVFCVCSLTPANAVTLGETQETASVAVDHIVSELQHKSIFAKKVIIPLDQLKDNTIVQVVNEKGYIRYIVYDGLVQTEEGKTIVLIKNIPFQSQRYMSLEEFQKDYTGVTISISISESSTDMAQELWKIQGNDLNKRLKSLKEHKSGLKALIFSLTISTGYYNYNLLKQSQKELARTERQIKKVEDEMIYLGFIGA